VQTAGSLTSGDIQELRQINRMALSRRVDMKGCWQSPFAEGPRPFSTLTGLRIVEIDPLLLHCAPCQHAK
jgi:hypothetical protein